jgi:hypothetical protein
MRQPTEADWRDGKTSSCDHDFEIFVISILLSNKA